MEAKWFAGRLRELRTEKGLTRDELADLAGIKATAVRDMEQGAYSPNWETVVALCKALEVGCQAFMQEPAKAPPVGRGRPRKQPEAVQPAKKQPKKQGSSRKRG